MRERPTQYVLLVRAFEEIDGEGRLLSLAQRDAAARRARMVTGLGGEDVEPSSVRSIREQETIVRRARQLYEILLRRVPALPGVLELARLGSGLAPLLVAGTLLLSLITCTLGPHDHINILPYSLLVLLAWNVGVAILALARPLVRVVTRREPHHPSHRSQSSFAMKAARAYLKTAMMRRKYVWHKKQRGSPVETRIAGEAFLRFGATWSRLSRRLMEARVRRMLHFGAAALLIGFMGGLYLRVEAFEYRATWKSLLLGADQVQLLLSWVLGPAAWILGAEIPNVAPLRAPLDGAPSIWLRLYTATVFVCAVIPRLLLALVETRRCRKLARNLPLDFDEEYYREILRRR